MFVVDPDAYDRFMGRYSRPLAEQFADLAGVAAGQRALDVGCGPGQLTEVLVRRLGARAVSAADPSPPFVEAARARFPALDVRVAGAERLPFDDDAFDAVLAQLVVQFMSDPVAGIAEMARTAAPGGVVAACVWDAAGGGSPLATFWTAAHDVDPAVTGEEAAAGAAEGHLAELFGRAGLADVTSGSLTVRLTHDSFDDWWEPYTLGVGTAGSHLASLDDDARAAVRERCRALLPQAPFTSSGTAWTVVARV